MDTNKIQTIMKAFEESQISKMDLTDGDLHIVLEKNIENVVYENVVREDKKVSQETTVPQVAGTEVKSPLVGTYYQASGQGQAPFVNVGDEVKIGDTLCIIEAMKVMNEVKAQVSGKVLSIDIKDGQTVEYDQVLMVIG